eukprot:9723406-Alexandrium_andersonii.AAC.1
MPGSYLCGVHAGGGWGLRGAVEHVLGGPRGGTCGPTPPARWKRPGPGRECRVHAPRSPPGP